MVRRKRCGALGVATVLALAGCGEPRDTYAELAMSEAGAACAGVAELSVDRFVDPSRWVGARIKATAAHDRAATAAALSTRYEALLQSLVPLTRGQPQERQVVQTALDSARVECAAVEKAIDELPDGDAGKNAQPLASR